MLLGVRSCDDLSISIGFVLDSESNAEEKLDVANWAKRPCHMGSAILRSKLSVKAITHGFLRLNIVIYFLGL